MLSQLPITNQPGKGNPVTNVTLKSRERRIWKNKYIKKCLHFVVPEATTKLMSLDEVKLAKRSDKTLMKVMGLVSIKIGKNKVYRWHWNRYFISLKNIFGELVIYSGNKAIKSTCHQHCPQRTNWTKASFKSKVWFSDI